MTNKKIIAILSAIIVIVGVFAACNQHTETSKDIGTTEMTSTTVIETIVAESQTESTTKQTTTKKADTTTSETNPVRTTKASTTVRETTTRKATTTSTTKRQETTTKKRETTTKKTTTTKKSETTSKKKETTTKAKSRCTNNNNHSLDCGNMGKWFSSKSDVKSYVNSVMNKYNSQYENGEITWEEYVKKCPCGYEAWSCSDCGKWTGNFKYN